MDLRQKLARLTAVLPLMAAGTSAPALSAVSEPPAPAQTTRARERIAELRAMIGDVVARDQKRATRVAEARASERSLPFPAVETEHGPLHVIDRWLSPHYRHGNARVSDVLGQRASSIATLALDDTLADIDLSRMLFLDTETTGLAGGTGTLAFLVGLAWFDEGVLRLEQLIVPSFGAERPVLARLAERVRAASCIVTYNGKAFDWPLLRTRFIMARVPLPALPPHLDLLHVTRRIWKPRLGGVRLTEIEREILRFEREGDIDGAEIPARYFAFLRDGATERLWPVIEHNQHDLIALAAMLNVLCERFDELSALSETSGQSASSPLASDARDCLAFAKVAARASDPRRALTFAQAALDGSQERELTLSALGLVGEVQRRAGDAVAAAAALEQALSHCRQAHVVHVGVSTPRVVRLDRAEPSGRNVPTTDPETQAALLHFALAKLYEHELRDLPRAYRHACATERVEGAELQGRRLGRLRRRLERG